MSPRKIVTLGFTVLLLVACIQIRITVEGHSKSNNAMIKQPFKIINHERTLSQLSSTNVHHSGLPKVDDIYYKAYPGALPETIVEEFINGETDWIEGPSRSDLHDQVIDAGHKRSEMDPMAEFTFFPINCRDYKVQTGTPNGPLNDSNWRLALSYVYGWDDKMDDIYGYYGVPWQYAIGNPVPDAQLPWYNASIQMPNTDFAAAWNILSTAGYTNDTDWLRKDGVDVRPGGEITCLYPTGATFYPDGPLGGMCYNWNDFITTYLGLNGPLMTVAPTDFTTLVTELRYTREYDIVGMELSNLGRYVDWIYDLSHSDNDVDWGWNFCGIYDAEFDTWAEIILTDLSVQNVIDAASDWQIKFVYELMPWIPVRAGLEFCTTANDSRGELTNLISMDMYGPRNDWSWMCLHWKGTPGVVWPGGSYVAALGDEPDSLNPYDEDTVYGWDMLGRALLTGETGLLGISPTDLRDMPFVATNWTVDHWTSIPELGIIDGSTATFYLRQDVTWHDGYPVTAYDCVYNMRTLRTYRPGRYSSTWANLVYEEADGPYKFNVYFASTSLYHLGNVAGTALLVPEDVIKAVEQQVEDGILDNFFDWDPCFNTYFDLMGEAPPAEYPYMKQIVGCGPFVFDYYDRPLAIGHVTRYEEFFVNAPVISSVHGEWRVDPDTTYTYNPLVQNLGAKTNTNEGECTNMTVDVEVYEDGLLAHTVTDVNLDPWEWTYLGPFTTGAQAIGAHNVTVLVFDAEDDGLIHTYVHLYVATIREDINTCTGEVLDFTVTMQEIGRVARAFHSVPGQLRWDPASDIDDDFFVSVIDLGSVAKMVGWPEGGGVPHNASQPYQVYLVANSTKTVVCSTCRLTVLVYVVNVTELGAYDIMIEYDTDLLELIGGHVISPFQGSVFEVADYLAITSMGDTPFNGSACIAELNFTAKTTYAEASVDPGRSILASGCIVTRIPYTPILVEVNVTKIGDITGPDGWPDGLCDMRDVGLVARLYGQYAPPASPNCDLTGVIAGAPDGIIDMRDVGLVARHYGEIDP